MSLVDDVITMQAEDQRRRKELEALAAIKSAQADIDERNRAGRLVDTLGALDFGQMRDASEPNPDMVGPLKPMPPVNTGFAKFDLQKPEGGQIGGRGILMPSQRKTLDVETGITPPPMPTSSPVQMGPNPKDIASRSLNDIASQRGLTGQYSEIPEAQNFVKNLGTQESEQRMRRANDIMATVRDELTTLEPGAKPNVGQIISQLAPYNDLPAVKNFTDQMVKLYDTGARSSVFSLQQDTPETKAAAMDRLAKLKADPDYASVDWDLWENAIQNMPNGAYKFFDKFSGGQQATGESIRKEELSRPGQVQTAAQTSAASTESKMTATDKAHKELGHTGINTSTGEPFSQNQFAAGGFANRMAMANQDLDRLQSAGFDPTTVKAAVLNSRNFNAIKDPNLQQYAQAKRNFINAVMRRESGAAIAPSEFDSAEQQYFAQLNDSPQVLEQKRKNRLAAYAAVSAESAGAEGLISNRYTELTGGGSPLPPDKAKRLAELRAKQKAGTQGR